MVRGRNKEREGRKEGGMEGGGGRERRRTEKGGRRTDVRKEGRKGALVTGY